MARVPERLVEVWAARRAGGPGKSGSGWVVGERGVLTAWHTVKESDGPGGELQSRPGRSGRDEDWFDCTVRWSDPELDVALLKVVDRRWRAPDCPCELANVGDQPLRCDVVGFPESESRPNGIPDTEQAYGTLLPAGGGRSGRVRFDVSTTKPKTAALWQGISGAAIRDQRNRRLMAVVTDTHPNRGQGRLFATAITDIAADEGFEQALRDVGQEPRLAATGSQPATSRERGDHRKSQRELRGRKLLADLSVQLGHREPPARLAAVYGLAGLADDWGRAGENQQRQTCIDILCGHLRIPITPFPGDNAPPKKLRVWRANHEVRHAIIGLIRDHLRKDAHTSWRSCDFDFTKARFDGGSFRDAEFSGWVKFHGAEFRAGDGIDVTFEGATFSPGCRVEFWGATFAGSHPIIFRNTEFAGGSVMFQDAQFEAKTVAFDGARFTGADVSFRGATFKQGTVTFNPSDQGHVEFAQEKVDFSGAHFQGGKITFRHALFNGATVLFGGTYTDATIGFWDTGFKNGRISFENASFDLGTGLTSFGGASFVGATVDFTKATFNGGEVDLREAGDWSHPPILPPGGRPGLLLPPEVP
ncbi:trypsin-like peptidase domain-containing protein [Kitasatospora sp. NPDC058444]|uniref:trypsin-like peptidase domain-containing protein n=1 Tax=Kitasatospora sp. NPDC058444 TaxID=3346504 RepID=UPI0036697511